MTLTQVEFILDYFGNSFFVSSHQNIVEFSLMEIDRMELDKHVYIKKLKIFLNKCAEPFVIDLRTKVVHADENTGDNFFQVTIDTKLLDEFINLQKFNHI